MTTWIPLSERRPTGQDCVLLYPVISDVGIAYTVSNPDYARGEYVLEQGYTHWAKFHPHPEEMEQYARNARLYGDDK